MSRETIYKSAVAGIVATAEGSLAAIDTAYLIHDFDNSISFNPLVYTLGVAALTILITRAVGNTAKSLALANGTQDNYYRAVDHINRHIPVIGKILFPANPR